MHRGLHRQHTIGPACHWGESIHLETSIIHPFSRSLPISGKVTRQKLSVGIAAEIGGKLFAPSVLTDSNKTHIERAFGDTVVEMQRAALAWFKRELCWKKHPLKSIMENGVWRCGNMTATQGWMGGRGLRQWRRSCQPPNTNWQHWPTVCWRTEQIFMSGNGAFSSHHIRLVQYGFMWPEMAHESGEMNADPVRTQRCISVLYNECPLLFLYTDCHWSLRETWPLPLYGDDPVITGPLINAASLDNPSLFAGETRYSLIVAIGLLSGPIRRWRIPLTISRGNPTETLILYLIGWFQPGGK